MKQRGSGATRKLAHIFAGRKEKRRKGKSKKKLLGKNRKGLEKERKKELNSNRSQFGAFQICKNIDVMLVFTLRPFYRRML